MTTDSKDGPSLETLEAEVETARARLHGSLQQLTSRPVSDAVKDDIKAYAETVKTQITEKFTSTSHDLVERARAATRERASGIAENLRDRAAENPLAVALIGAGIGWRFYKKPPVAALLLGAGIASLFMNKARGKPFKAYHDPYRDRDPATYVPGGVAGYGYPVEAEAPGPTIRERVSALSENVESATEAVRESIGNAAQRVAEATESGRARVAEAVSSAGDRVDLLGSQLDDALREAQHEVRAYGRQASEAFAEHRGRYSLLLGAIALSAAAIGFGAMRLANGNAQADRGSDEPEDGEAEEEDFATSESGFIDRLSETPAKGAHAKSPTEANFLRDSAIATEDIVGDTEPATRGGEVTDAKSAPESDAVLKARGGRRSS